VSGVTAIPDRLAAGMRPSARRPPAIAWDRLKPEFTSCLLTVVAGGAHTAGVDSPCKQPGDAEARQVVVAIPDNECLVPLAVVVADVSKHPHHDGSRSEVQTRRRRRFPATAPFRVRGPDGNHVVVGTWVPDRVPRPGIAVSAPSRRGQQGHGAGGARGQRLGAALAAGFPRRGAVGLLVAAEHPGICTTFSPRTPRPNAWAPGYSPGCR
jgi:hypothetical protein